MSPLARRGSRFWGRTGWPLRLFWEKRGPFGELVDCGNPPGDALELLTLELSIVLACARGDDRAGRSAVGNSLSAKSSNQERKY